MKKLINQDCYEAMKSLPDHSIDLILTDPPYNVREVSTGNISLKGRKDFNNDIAEWDAGFKPSDLKEHFLRLLKPTGNLVSFTGFNLVGHWHSAFDEEFDRFNCFVWHKTNPTPKVRKVSFLNSCEIAVCFWNGGHTFNFSTQNDMHNFFESPACGGNERLDHPTQKPESILRHLIKICSNEGDTVLDPFMGVGSVGAAALSLHRNFIGIEIDKHYFEQAENRLKFNKRRLKR